MRLRISDESTLDPIPKTRPTGASFRGRATSSIYEMHRQSSTLRMTEDGTMPTSPCREAPLSADGAARDGFEARSEIRGCSAPIQVEVR